MHHASNGTYCGNQCENQYIKWNLPMFTDPNIHRNSVAASITRCWLSSPSSGEGTVTSWRKANTHNVYFNISKYLSFGHEEGMCSHGNSLQGILVAKADLDGEPSFPSWRFKRITASWGPFSSAGLSWVLESSSSLSQPWFLEQLLSLFQPLKHFFLLLLLKIHSTNLELKLQGQHDYTSALQLELPC